MTTITVSTGQVALIASAVLVAVAFLAGIATLCIARGWVHGSATVKAVPPWQRKPRGTPSPVPAVAVVREVDKAAAAGTDPKPVRIAGGGKSS